ncbi:MAG: CHAT domain-containing protein [Caldilineaceae bacterium]
MSTLPAIFLAFANDSASPLPALADEARRIKSALKASLGRDGGLCELVAEPYATLGSVFNTFQDSSYRGRIAIFHFAGHAGLDFLRFETDEGVGLSADAAALAAFLRRQPSLRLVVLNGCVTAEQARAMSAAGLPAVIASNVEIADHVGALFAERFYQALGAGLSVQQAFDDARDMVLAQEGTTWGLEIYRHGDTLADWRLQDLVDDPLWDLQPLPLVDLPANPYRYLNWFRYEDAPIFFGRRRQIRELYELLISPASPPVVLLYGQSGVGKSSLLEAGLRPRLEQVLNVRYTRRSQDTGLPGALAAALGTRDVATIAEAWKEKETGSGRPFVLLVDQVEEVFTRPQRDQPGELQRLVATCSAIFAVPQSRPAGKLVLSFRKEYLAEIEKRCITAGLPHAKYFLERLDRAGIIDAAAGPAVDPRLRRHYGLSIEDDLPEQIASDLLADHGSSIAPVLQVLLAKAWERAKKADYDHPRYHRDLYAVLRSEGLALEDFLGQQLNALHAGDAEAVDSGLALDVLAFHTTRLGTAEERTQPALLETYAHNPGAVLTLVQELQDLYLLVDPAKNQPGHAPAARLAHDTLAPVVRARFEESDAPGQRARRVLEGRSVDWAEGRTGTPLDSADLSLVEAGLAGMRALTADEQRLLDASREERDRRAEQLKEQEGIRLRSIQAEARVKEQQRTASRLQRRAAALALALAAAVTLALAAGWFYTLAEQERGSALNARATAVANAQTAQVAESEAVTARNEVEQLNFLIRINQLAQSALAAADKFPQRALLLAVAAYRLQEQSHQPASRETRQALWDLLSRFGGEPLWHHEGASTAVAYSPTGGWLATGGSDGKVVLHKLNQEGMAGEAYMLADDEKSVVDLQFSPDGRLLIALFYSSFYPRPEWNDQDPYDGPIMAWDIRSNVQRVPVFGPDAQCTYGAIAFSSDGRMFGCGTTNGAQLFRVQLDAALGTFTLRPTVNIGEKGMGNGSFNVNSLAFSTSGKWLATGGPDGTQLWDLSYPASIPQALNADSSGNIRQLEFSPDGHWLIGVSLTNDANVIRLDGADGPVAAKNLRLRNGSISAVAFSPDGRKLLTAGSDGSVALWNADLLAADQVPVMLHESQDAVPPPGVERSAAAVFSNDGRWVAVASSAINYASVWTFNGDNTIGAARVLEGHEAGIAELVFDDNSNWIATAGRDGAVRLWHLAQKAVPAVPIVLNGGTFGSALAFSSDGAWLASGETDDSVLLWVLDGIGAAPRQYKISPFPSLVRSLEFDRTRRWLAVSGDNNDVMLWDVRSLPPTRSITLARFEGEHDGGGEYSPAPHLAISSDGRWLAAASYGKNSTRLWDLNLQDPSSSPVVLAGFAGDVFSVAFQDDSSRLATAMRSSKMIQMSGSSMPSKRRWPYIGTNLKPTFDGSLYLWNLGQEHPFMAPATISDLDLGRPEFALSPSGRWAAVIEKDSRLVLLDLSRDPPTRYWLQHQDVFNNNGERMYGPTDLAFSPDGRWLVGVVGFTVVFWQVPLEANSLPAFSVSAGEHEVDRLAFSKDGRWLATTSDDVVRIWDIAADNPAASLLELPGHGATLNEVVFSPDGQWLAAAGDSHVYLWALLPEDLVELACKAAGRDLTDQERSQYLNDNQRINVCSDREIAEPSVQVLVTPTVTPVPTSTPQPTATTIFLSPLPLPDSPLAVPPWFQ